MELASSQAFLLRRTCKAAQEAVWPTYALQSLQKQYDRLAARFFRQSPAILVRILHELGTDGAVKLLRRDDLCCPLECFLVQVGVNPIHARPTINNCIVLATCMRPDDPC